MDRCLQSAIFMATFYCNLSFCYGKHVFAIYINANTWEQKYNKTLFIKDIMHLGSGGGMSTL